MALTTWVWVKSELAWGTLCLIAGLVGLVAAISSERDPVAILILVAPPFIAVPVLVGLYFIRRRHLIRKASAP